MKGPSSFPQILCHVLLLALAGSSAFAQQPQLVQQEARSLTPPAQTIQPVRKAPEQKTVVDASLAPDAMRNKWLECEKSAQDLQGQVDALQVQNTDLQKQLQVAQQQLKETTHPGGSAVTAYCESGSVSRNTAGATNDCGFYACEPVSGLCRTQCDNAGQCKEKTDNISYVCDWPSRECIPSK
jgi:hypothetical protein